MSWGAAGPRGPSGGSAPPQGGRRPSVLITVIAAVLGGASLMILSSSGHAGFPRVLSSDLLLSHSLLIRTPEFWVFMDQKVLLIGAELPEPAQNRARPPV